MLAPNRQRGHDGDVVLMVALGILLVVGVALTVSWGATGYLAAELGVETRGEPERLAPDQILRSAERRYLRGVAIAIVSGFWAGALVTGPAVRLIMRLLAVTAGEDAQGAITEAEQVVGRIDLGGTVGLIAFGGIFPGLLSGVIYVLVRRWLPSGRLTGVTYGALHLVFAATTLDPLRPNNPDFDLVGPGWLSATTFGLACVFHGMAVVAFAHRYSQALPPDPDRKAVRRARLPLVLPALVVVVSLVGGVVILAGLVVVSAVSRLDGVTRVARSGTVLMTGRIALAAAAIAMLPGTVADLRDVVVRDEPAVRPAGE